MSYENLPQKLSSLTLHQWSQTSNQCSSKPIFHEVKHQAYVLSNPHFRSIFHSLFYSHFQILSWSSNYYFPTDFSNKNFPLFIINSPYFIRIKFLKELYAFVASYLAYLPWLSIPTAKSNPPTISFNVSRILSAQLQLIFSNRLCSSQLHFFPQTPPCFPLSAKFYSLLLSVIYLVNHLSTDS